jgi:hypothetical protein
MPKENIYSIVSHYHSNKSIITTCIANFGNAYCYILFSFIFIFPIFTHFITQLPSMVEGKDKVSLKYLLSG